MPAYIVSIKRATKDPEQLKVYAQKAPGSVRGPMKRLVTSSGKFRTLVGGAAEGMSILEFPSLAEAEAWFQSPAYQEALQHLLRGADYEMFLVEGETELFRPG